MKKSLLILTVTAAFLCIIESCGKKEKGSSRSIINSISGTWRTKSISCYNDTTFYLTNIPADSYIKFKTDLSGETYSGTPTMRYTNFQYDILNDDSTLIFFNPAAGGGTIIPDTFIIMKITANQLIYHSANKILHGSGLYLCRNTLDSLYR